MTFNRMGIAAAVLLAGTALTAAQAAERSFNVAAFDRVEVSGAQDVAISTGKAVSVRAEGSDAALDKLVIKVEGGKLKIGTKSSWGMSWSSDKVHVSITVPMVRGVEMAGSGNIVVDRVQVADFGAEVAGSGNVRVDQLEARTAKFEIAGSGNIDARGSCTDGKAEIAGSGDMRLSALKCVNFHAEIAGSGDIAAMATTSADIDIAGSGDVRITGGARCTISKAGSGKVVCGG